MCILSQEPEPLRYCFYFNFLFTSVLLQSVDWWSLGILMFELLTGASPFTLEGERNSQSEVSK